MSAQGEIVPAHLFGYKVVKVHTTGYNKHCILHEGESIEFRDELFIPIDFQETEKREKTQFESRAIKHNPHHAASSHFKANRGR